MELEKADNLMKYSDEIYNRPKKTWFQSNKERNNIRKLAKQEVDELDGQTQEKTKKYIKKMK